MHMSPESLLVILLIGAIAGWLAGQIVQGTGFGLVGDIIIGIVGAFIASWLFPQLPREARVFTPVRESSGESRLHKPARET
jgi:uncharacterized membrane protein YeaQ/YmgE (transglycosylase-associated protein family)